MPNIALKLPNPKLFQPISKLKKSFLMTDKNKDKATPVVMTVAAAVKMTIFIIDDNSFFLLLSFLTFIKYLAVSSSSFSVMAVIRFASGQT